MENLGSLLLEYFSVEPASLTVTDKNDKNGLPITIRTPNDLPTPAGFASKHNISERRLNILLAASPELQEIAEICQAKMKYFIQVNGLAKGAWEQTFTALLAKNEIGYAEKSESVVTERRELAPTDIKLLEEMGLRVSTPHLLPA